MKKLLEAYQRECHIDVSLYRRMRRARGNTVIKVAGNIDYPTGLRTERPARDVLALSRRYDLPFEEVAGHRADPYTMIGDGAQNQVPVLVTVPQLVGSGEVGLSIRDAIPISERCQRMEMSGFARIPGSLPVVGNIGEIWPVMPTRAADALGVRLDFMCCKQFLPAGQECREWIVRNVKPVDRDRMFAAIKKQALGIGHPAPLA